MPWFKVDDQLALHRKARAAGNAAMGLWVRAGSLCSAQLDDGHVDADVPALLGGRRGDAARLVSVGFWHVAGHDCEECPQPRDPDGWVFHDWEAKQPTRAEIESQRSEKSRNGRLGNHRRWHEGENVIAPDCEFCDSHEGSQKRSQVRPRSESPRPGPSRPNAAAAASSPAAAPVDNSPTSLDLPPAVEILRATLEARKLLVRWDRLTTDQLTEIERLVETHGDSRLVDAAVRAYRADRPIAFAQGWISGWQALPTPGQTLRAVPAPQCPEHGHTDPANACTQCAGERKAAR